MQRLQTMTQPAAHHPILPTGMYLGHVKELLQRVRPHIGLSLANLNVLMMMMADTASNDWTDPSRDAVCFRSQQDVAARIGISERFLRRSQSALLHLGLIERHTGNNGRRSGTLLSNGTRLGISFAPLIELVPTFIALRDKLDYEDGLIPAARLQCSAARRDLREALETAATILNNPEIDAARTFYADLPRRYSDYKTLAQLQEHQKSVDSVTDIVLDVVRLSSFSSASAEHQVPTILNTTKNNSVFCNGSSVSEKTGRNRPDNNIQSAKPYGLEEDAKNKDVRAADVGKSYDLDWLTPAVIYDMAPDEMRFYLDAYRETGAVTLRSLTKAVLMRTKELGINESAWEEAAEAMGNTRAALCVLQIDINRFHPKHPIHSPGGVLRAMTYRHSAGTLNLAQGLIGIKSRARA